MRGIGKKLERIMGLLGTDRKLNFYMYSFYNVINKF